MIAYLLFNTPSLHAYERVISCGGALCLPQKITRSGRVMTELGLA